MPSVVGAKEDIRAIISFFDNIFQAKVEL